MTREPDFWFACVIAVILAATLVFGPGGLAS